MANPVLKVLTDAPASTLRPAIETLAAAGATIACYDCQTEEQLAAEGRDALALLVFLARTPVTRRVVEALPTCRIIARAGIGVDNVDVAAASERGIWVTNLPDYCVDEVSSHAVALLLDCARKITRLDRQVHAGGFEYMGARPAFRLAGSTVGLVGFGRIGRSAACKLRGFDVRLLVCDPYVSEETIREQGGEPADLGGLLHSSDYICLFLPMTSETYHLIGEKQLGLMKSTAYLINTSRGGLIDQGALADALEKHVIAGAGLDVLETEPVPRGERLLELENVVITPHTGWYSEESVADNRRQAAEEIVRVLTGQAPRHAVNQI